MKPRTTYSLAVAGIIIGALALPAIFKQRGHPPLVGPDLSELDYTEVAFENRRAGLSLAGMLFLPEGEGPFPTAIIIHGSGTSRRNNVWYLSVVEHLQRRGVAVLLPDKRGSEKSEGDWIGVDFGKLATDTTSAIAFVREQRLFEYAAIGLIGMSQGGWIAPVVATESDDLAFVVGMVGSTVTTDEQLLYEETHNIAHYTYTPVARALAPITTERLKRLEHVAAYVGFDPIPYWKRVDVPVFLAFGGNDENVPVEASIHRLTENNLDHFMVRVYADGGHAIRDVRTNTVSGEFLDDLTRFIKDAL